MSIQYSCVRTLYGVKSSITCLSFSPTGKELAVGMADGTLKIFGVNSGKVLQAVSRLSAVTAILWHPSKHRSLFVGYEDGRLDVVRVNLLFHLRA